MTFQAAKDKKVTPSGMQLTRNLGTCVAQDIISQFVDTDGRKNTLHDAVRITPQLGLQEDMLTEQHEEKGDGPVSLQVEPNNIKPGIDFLNEGGCNEEDK